MDETVTIGGKQVKLLYLYVAAGAAGLGYVAWRWSQTRGTAAPPATDQGAGGTGVADGSPSTVGAGNNTYTGTAPPDGDPRTNAEWTRRAVGYMTDSGYSSLFASVTIGKWLAGTALSDAEEQAIGVAVSQTGQPPVGGPYPVKKLTGTTPATGGASAPVLSASGSTPWVTLSWTAVAGATGYTVTARNTNAPSARLGNPGSPSVGNVRTYRYWQGPGTNIYTVRATLAGGGQSPDSNAVKIAFKS